MKKQSNVVRIILWAVVLIPILYVSGCNIVSHTKNEAFDKINNGDTKQQVIQAMGNPSVSEQMGAKMFSRYASQACVSPCTQRLWFENRLSLDIEAWSVELDSSGKVINKAHWMSS